MRPLPVKRYVVGRARDLPPGSRTIAHVSGRSIGVFNVAGKYFAIRNRCPHQGGPLCRGTLSGLTTARFDDDRAPEPVIDRDGEILKCPWHGWQFDLRTGHAVFGERVRAAVYRAYPADESAALEDVPIPGSAEVYATSVEDGVIVVEIPQA